jgi:two-component system LytT family sensor kinase
MPIEPATSARVTRLLVVLAAWTLAGLLLATQAWASRAMRGEPIAWLHTLAIWLAWAYLWALLTPLVFRLVDRFPLVRPHRLRDLQVHALAGVVLAAGNLALFAFVAPGVGAMSVGADWMDTYRRLVGTALLLNIPVYWLVVGGLLWQRAAAAARARERRALQLEAQLSEARLSALRAQLQPHFLFNALNTISVLMHEDVDRADRVLVLLSQLLRRGLDASMAGEVALHDEIAFIDAYLEIEKARFDQRLHYRLDIEPGLLDARVPSLILQPLVENAVRHGLAGRVPGRIEVSARRVGDHLKLAVTDSGRGRAEGAPDGVGLSNTRARLRLLYGADHGFELAPATGGGLRASLWFPLRIGVTPA